MLALLHKLNDQLPINMAVYNKEGHLLEGFNPIRTTFSSCESITIDDYTIQIETTREHCLETILNTINEGVMLASVKGNIVFYNASMARLEGLNKEDVVGKKIIDVYQVHPNESEHHLVKTTGAPIIDRYLKYGNSPHKLIQSVASTYPIFMKGQIIATYSIATNVDSISKLLEKTRHHEQGPYIDFALSHDNLTRFDFNHIVTRSENMLCTVEYAKSFAQYRGNILISGETGVGKELIAQSIHNENPVRKLQPFVGLNCSAIPDNLLESTLFGTTKGAYTGAENNKGLIEEAGMGTLFLDEINSMPLTLQAKLLRVIQEQEFRPVGSKSVIKMRCRIISSTNVDPDICLREGLLRSDLYYRLAVLTLSIPALRNRQEDIIPLAKHFMQKHGTKYGRYQLKLMNDAQLALMAYDYPGNVRELENIIESAITFAPDSGEISVHHLPRRLFREEPKKIQLNHHLKSYLAIAERNKLIEVLELNDWNITKSAEALCIHRQNLQYRMKKLNIIKAKSHSNW